MAMRMLIDAAHPEETRVVVQKGNRLEAFEFESASRKPLKGNIYLAKVIRVEPSLQAAFVEYGGNRHGFLAFGEIHPDYYQIPVADRQKLLADQAAAEAEAEAEAEAAEARAEAGEPAESESDASAEGLDGEHKAGAHGDTENDGADQGEDENDDDGGDVEQTEDGAADHDEEGRNEGGRLGAISRSPTLYDDAPAQNDRPDDLPDITPDEQGTAESGENTGEDPGVSDSDLAAADENAWQSAGGSAIHADDANADDANADDDSGRFPAAAAAGEETPDSWSAEGQSESDRPAAQATPESEGARPAALPGRGGRGRGRGRGRHDRGHRSYDSNGGVVSLGGDAMDEARSGKLQNPFRRYKIQEVIKRRQILLVQVVKEERANKGAALTTYMSLAGRYCVLMPNTTRAGGVSRKIGSTEDRKRLRSMMSELDTPEGMGVIIRTAGMERTKAEIKRDYEYLLRTWDSIRELTLHSTAPNLVYEEANLIKRSIRDLYSKDIDELLIEGEEAYKAAKEFMKVLMPSHARKVQRYRERIPLFHRFQVEQQFDEIYSPTVQLKSGGSIVLNTTEALVAIDVNSGRSTREHHIEETAYKTNLEAADEVARQLRLRDLAGLIVIDFIDMEDSRNQRNVEQRLREALKIDRARIQVGRISAFGLLEMSRQRLRPSLLEATTLPCPHCLGRGYVRSIESTALHVLRAIEEEGIRERSSEIDVRVAGAVAIYLLNRKRDEIGAIEKSHGMRVVLSADDSLIPPDYRIERLKAREEGAIKGPPAVLVSAIQPPQAEPDNDEELPDDTAEDDAEKTQSPVQLSERHSEGRAAEPENGSGESRGSGEGRGRRRRRRRRPGEGHGAPRDSAPPSATGTQGMGSQDTGSQEMESPSSESGQSALSQEIAAGPETAAGPTGEGEMRKRRRGHRGGRRRRRRPGEGQGGQIPQSANGSENNPSGFGAPVIADDSTTRSSSDPMAASSPIPSATSGEGAPAIKQAESPPIETSRIEAPRIEIPPEAPAPAPKSGWWRRS